MERRRVFATHHGTLAENRATHEWRFAKSSPFAREARMLNSVNEKLQNDDEEM
jgi:hypothetical protein